MYFLNYFTSSFFLHFFYPRHLPTPTPTTHTHDPRPLPTTHDPRHLATLNSDMAYFEGLNGVNRQKSNGQKFNREPSKKLTFYHQPSKKQINTNRQNVSRTSNLTFQLILARLLAPEESLNWKNKLNPCSQKHPLQTLQ